MVNDTAFYRILVAIETDATRFHGPDAIRPAVLGKADSEQLLAHLAADLSALLPEISSCSLIAAGALLDQTQVLRPLYPVFQALENVSIDHRADRFKPGLVSVGASDGHMPVAALQPDPGIPPGLLLLLPVVVHGPAGLVQTLGQDMEYRFLEEGQLSAHSAAWLQSAFGVTVNHARLMTLTDLNAMLRLQLDHFGFLPLWELIDAALDSTESLAVTTDQGNRFEWRDGAVHTDFQTFDHWARRGAGVNLPGERGALAEAYAGWTRELRQYLTTLNAHGLEVVFHLPGGGPALESSYFHEQGLARPGSRRTAVTEHSWGDLGAVAISVVDGETVRNYYPLRASGLNDIHADIRRLIPAGHTVSFPGGLLYDETERRLVADSRQPSSDH